MELKIKDIRVSNNLTQKELASILNVRQSSISRWEKGIAKPSKRVLALLSKHFGYSQKAKLVDCIALFIKNSDVCLTLMDEKLRIKEVSKGLLIKRNYTYKQALALDLNRYITKLFQLKFERSLSLGLLTKGGFSTEFHIDMNTIEGEKIFMNVRLTPILGLTETPLILSETKDILAQEFSANKFIVNHLLPFQI